jgi:diguanylate cyclase (GGDEF)-like protein
VPQLLPTVSTQSPPEALIHPAQQLDTKHVEIVNAARRADRAPTTLPDALIRLAEAEDTLRAIGAGEIDAFVVADGGAASRVFTLSTADRPYRMFVENMRDGAATLSSSGLILWANRRLAQMLSCSKDTIVGSSLTLFMVGDVQIGLDEIRGAGGLGATLEIVLVDADGTAVPVLVGSSPLDVDGDLLTCLTFTDLSAKKAQEREIARLGKAQAERMADLEDAQAALTKQATHDALTGLPNRALLVDRIDQALLLSRRSGRPAAVLFIDLDRFKQVNDTHGHAVGDTVLKRTADQLVAALRSMDTLARIGGDEFVVLAPDLESHLHAVDIGTRLVTDLNRRPDRVADSERVAASIGISISVGGRGTAETLLHEADAAMYQAKALGGGRAEVFDEALGHQVQERAAAQGMLQSALDDRRVIAYYQPIIDLSTGHIAGFEALARISEHDGTVLPPAAFITVAEDSGLVVPLGTQVLELACLEANGWQSAGLPENRWTVAVNLSSRQFEPGDLTEVLRRTLEETGLDPGRLHLEITETAIMNLRPDILKQLRDIRELGVQIGLDDFGTGYASLTHLRRLPLSFVKIDQSFVQGLGTDQEDERIVSAVVELAANLGLRSIAEGIETKDQLDRLRKLGCDQAQGYLFARPLPPADAPTAIQDSGWMSLFE